tara:strand:+ start:329 stop:1717 length:1389 start_codon:yes stop_codon:yes gene_type:complete
MAVKFSQFTTENNAANITSIVGYTTGGNLNVQIPPANLDTTYTLASSASGSDVVLTLDGTKPGGTATDDTITITQGSGISFSSVTAAGFTIEASGAVTTVDEGTPTASTGAPLTVNPTTGDVKVIAHTYNGTTNVGYVPTGGSSSTFLRGDGTWVTPGGSFTGFDISGDTGTQTVGNGDTITFAGGTNIATAVTATDTVTINLDTAATIWTLAGGDAAGTSQAITPGNTAQFKENDGTVVNSVQVGGGIQTKAAATDQLLLDQTSEQVITVGGGVFVVDGASQPTIVLPRGFTYEFNQDAATNDGHPLVIGTASGSSPYTTGIQYYGSTSANTLTPVAQNVYENTTNFNSYATRRVRLRITQNTPALYYYCSVHGAGMGGSIAYGGSAGVTKTVDSFAISNASTNSITVTSATDPTSKDYIDVYINGVYQAKANFSALSGKVLTLAAGNFPNGSTVEAVTTT